MFMEWMKFFPGYQEPICLISPFTFYYPEFHFLKVSTLPHFMGWKMNLEEKAGISLVVQWLRIHLSMQGMQIQSLVGKRDPTCHGATKPKCCNQRKSGCCSKDPVQTKKIKKKGEEKGLPRDCDRIMFVKMGKTKEKSSQKSVVWDDLRD